MPEGKADPRLVRFLCWLNAGHNGVYVASTKSGDLDIWASDPEALVLAYQQTEPDAEAPPLAQLEARVAALSRELADVREEVATIRASLDRAINTY